MQRLLEALGGPRWLAALFLLCALPTGLGLALLTPMNMFSDEPAHIARADGLRYGGILGVPAPGAVHAGRTGVIINTGIFNILFTQEAVAAYPDKPVPAAARRQAEAVPWDNHPIWCPTQMVEYFPVFYTPAALGLLAGEKLGLTPLHTVYLGRIAMLLSYVAIGTAAIALARYGAVLLFAVLTLPGAINLGSSYNQDGLMIASCALAASLLTRGPGRSWLAGLAVLIAVVCAKTPYGALLLLCLPPLLAPGVWRRAGITLLAAVLPVLWLAHTLHNGFIPYTRAPYHPGPLWPGAHDIFLNTVQPRGNFQVLLVHPAQIFILPLITVKAFWWSTWPLILGGVASGNVRVPGWEYPWLIFALGAAAFGAAMTGAIRAADAGLAALALFGAFIGMELSLYLTSTAVGLPYIEGVSARYFLPLLPFFIFLLPLLARLPGVARLPRPAPFWFSLPAALMAGANIYALPAYIFHIFRMPGP